MTQNYLDREAPDLGYFIVPGKDWYFGLSLEGGGGGSVYNLDITYNNVYIY